MNDSQTPIVEQDAAAPAALKKAPVGKAPAVARRGAAAKTAASKASPRAKAPVQATLPADKAVKEGKHPGKKPKLVRDSFTFPAVDYAQIGTLKQRALKAGHEVKKSELLRAGLAALSVLSDAALLEALRAVDRLKPGRPHK